jgi:Secretion system C-terminal sorting domain/FG-GAP-like repeat
MSRLFSTEASPPSARNFRTHPCTFAFLLCTLLIPSVALTQPQWIEYPISQNAEGIKTLQSGDIDGDGDQDLFAAVDGEEYWCWWEFDGTQHQRLRLILPIERAGYAALLFDMDEDGDADLIAEENDPTGNLVLWRNEGDGTSWTNETLGELGGSLRSIHNGDIDNDGDQDLISITSGESDHQITLWENVDEGLWVEHAIADTATNDGTVRLGDVDGNGWVDIAFVWRNPHTYQREIWISYGDGTQFGDWNMQTRSGKVIPYLFDIDGDGDLDLLRAGSYVSWLENTGQEDDWPIRMIVDADEGEYADLYAADMDQDGDLDIISGYKDYDWNYPWDYTDGYVMIWTQVTDDEWERYDLVSGEGASLLFAADFDNDSDIDIVSTDKWDVTFDDWVNVSIGDEYAFDRYHIAARQDFDHISPYDYNDDGLIDLAVGGTRIGVLEQTLDGSWVDHEIYMYGELVFELAVADYDADGIEELGELYFWVSNDGMSMENHSRWWEYNIQTGNWGSRWIDAAEVHNFAAGDIDGDGDADIATSVSGTYYVGIRLFENPGDGQGWIGHGWIAIDYFGEEKVFVDMDQDGDLDLFVENQGVARWFENNNGWNNWPEHGTGIAGISSLISVADHDNDGDTDVFDKSGNAIRWWENVDGSWESTIAVAAIGSGGCCVGDLDNDGDMDIVFPAEPGALTYALNMGDGIWIEYPEVQSQPYIAAKIADIDEDGFRDIISSKDGSVSWWRNPGLTQVSEQYRDAVPTTFSLPPIYPNPFNGTATISLTIPSPGELNVALFNVLGQEVMTLARGPHVAGTHNLTVDASALVSGVYFVRADMLDGGRSVTRKIVLMK